MENTDFEIYQNPKFTFSIPPYCQIQQIVINYSHNLTILPSAGSYINVTYKHILKTQGGLYEKSKVTLSSLCKKKV